MRAMRLVKIDTPLRLVELDVPKDYEVLVKIEDGMYVLVICI